MSKAIGVVAVWWLLSATGLAQTDAVLVQSVEAAADPQALNDLIRGLPATAATETALRGRADALFQSGDFEKALRLNQAAAAVALRMNDGSQAARAYRASGLCYRRLGRQADSLRANQEGLQYGLAAGDAAVSADLYRGIGLAQRALGHNDAAIEAYRRSIERCGAAQDRDCALRSSSNLGGVYSQIGAFRDAAEVLQSGLEEATRLGSPMELGLLNNLAVAYASQGDGEMARTYFEKGLALARAQNAKADEAMAIANLVPFYRVTDRKTARSMAEDGMRLAEETNQPRLSAWLLMNLAGIDVAEQRYDQALERLAASRRRFAGQGQRGSLALSLAATAAVYADRQLDAEALEWAAKAQTEARASGYVDALWIALDAGGRASRHAGRREEARAAFREQIALNESARPQLAGGEAEKGQFLSSRTHPYYALMEMAVEDGRFEEALQSLEAAKARALVDIIENGRADPGPLMTEAERREDQRLAAAVESGTAAALRGDAAARSRWDDAKRDLTVFRTALYAVHPELKLRRGQFAAFRLGDAADLVPDARTLLVEFALSGGRLFAFTLARDARGEAALRVTSSEWNADEAARQVEAFRASLAERSLGYRQAARALYGRIFSPVAEQLRGKSVVGIVPDGVLWGVPLQALVGPDGRHVLEDHAIFYAPSLTALREIRQRRARTPATNAAVLAFGAPAAEKFAGALAPLLDSAREVELVGAVYGRGASAVSTGAAARKSVWMREAPRWGVLHLATHGEVNTNNPLYSYLVLSDGVIEAREILGLDLHAQLVVLSACETGLGSVTSGEGLIGLSWAFLVAGSPAALVSQWKVDSRSTGELMAEFHRAYRAGGYAAARALQRAALATMRVPGYHHPFYWAAFVVLGAGY